MNNNEEKIGIFYPSFKLEKKTKAFNKYIGAFVALISMFTVGVGIIVFHVFMCYYLNLISTFIQDNLIIFMLLPVIIFIALSYKLAQWLSSLMSSYKFEDGKITKGIIQRANKVKGIDLAIDTALLANMINNIGDSSSVVASNAISNLNNILNLIALNSEAKFVEQYFDTDLYKKNVYENPKLVKETKYSLIYTCDNKRKLVIPKIYEGICDVESKKESSFIGRILKKSVLVFVIALIIAIFDLSIGYTKNTEYINNISNVKINIEQQLEEYGYTLKKINEKLYTFSKELGNGERRSEVKYYFDKNGSIIDVDVQLYYDSTSENVGAELLYIIRTLNDNFDSNDINDFVDLVEENINGNYKYGKLKSEKYILTLGRSGEYVDIHSY